MNDRKADPGMQTWRARFRTWLASVDIPRGGDSMEQSYARNLLWHKALAEAGWLGVNWPVEFGGQGLSTEHQMAVMEEIALARAPFPLAIINLYVVGPTLVSWGTPEQKERHLRRILQGDEIWYQGFSEPDAGSDLASMRTRAVLDGEHFIVNGQKIWTSQAHFADYCGLMVRTDPASTDHRGLTYLIVDMKTPGVRVQPVEQLTGDAMFNQVFFDEVRVPVSNMIGALHKGWNVAMRSLASERSVIIAQRKAEAEAMFRLVLDALATRYADVGQLPERIALRLGHARMQLAALDAQVRDLVVRLQHDGAPPGTESVDKLILTDVEQEIFALAFDMLGPYRQVPGGAPLGMDSSSMIYEFFYSRSRSISGGTTQVQRDIVAKRVLKLPLA